MDSNLHPLLSKQLFEANKLNDKCFSDDAFLQKINQTYLLFETTQKQLEQSLEILRKQKKHTNIKLERISRNSNNAINNITEVVFETDLNGNWIYLNQAWEKLTGLKVIDCLGEQYTKYLGILKPKDNLELNLLSNSNFKSFCKVIEIKSPKGESIWLDLNVKKLFALSGKTSGYIGTICDITSQKRVELSLLKEKEKEILANKAKDEFLSTISHEIRTPLNAVIGISHLLLLEDPQNSQLENLNILKHSSEHLLSLVNDVLDFGKIESGNIELESIAFDFSNSINGFLGTYSSIAEENEINFSINKDSLIPDTLVGDPTRLTQILSNLLSNAIKFTKSGAVALNIQRLSQSENEITLNFEVIDTGIGISKQEQFKIFNAFTQANTSTARKFGGTGLGLSICKKLLQLMGSDISLKSKPNVGSVFSFPLTFKLPKNSGQIIKKGNNSCTSLKGLSVLVAEDNKVNCILIKKFLSKWDVNFEIANDGKEAVKKYKEGEFDIILMDIMMPNMNGLDATRAIRLINTEIPIIALSAATGSSIEKEYDEVGMNGHLSKPFNPNALFNLLGRIYFSRYKKTVV